jgi:phage terminase small subunit
MPILENSRHEIFAQELVKGATQTEAYLTAGYKGDKTAASRLSTNVNVQRRVAELKADAAVRARKSMDDILEQLDDDRQFAREMEAPSAAIQATMGQAKILGYDKQLIEHTGKDGGPIETADLSDMETIKRMRFLMSRAKVQPSIN